MEIECIYFQFGSFEMIELNISCIENCLCVKMFDINIRKYQFNIQTMKILKNNLIKIWFKKWKLTENICKSKRKFFLVSLKMHTWISQWLNILKIFNSVKYTSNQNYKHVKINPKFWTLWYFSILSSNTLSSGVYSPLWSLRYAHHHHYHKH